MLNDRWASPRLGSLGEISPRPPSLGEPTKTSKMVTGHRRPSDSVITFNIIDSDMLSDDTILIEKLTQEEREEMV